MSTFFSPRQFLTAAFIIIFGCLAKAEDEQKSMTVNTSAGILSSKISESEKYEITSLKIIGRINGTDIKFIRQMTYTNSGEKEGKLTSLDLSEATIVGGVTVIIHP